MSNAEKKKKSARKKTTAKKAAKKTTQKKTSKKTAKKKVARRKTPAAAPKVQPPIEPIEARVEAPLPPEPTITGPYIDRGADLPAGFGDDRIHALVRDPDWVFVYWELYGDGSNQLVQARGGGREFTQLPWHLRVLDQDGSVQQEIGVYVGANNWYVRTGETKHASVQIGFYDESGAFVVAASTEEVSTPSGTPSEDRTETWARRTSRWPIKLSEKEFEMEPASAPPGGEAPFTETSSRAGGPTSPGRYPPSGRPPHK
ncbi:MAG: DUF4912 domain-containing protein [Planctomycetes bacterium]|nr:DUF4912 domain-containing protein [Planctomycetota bacterium]